MMLTRSSLLGSAIALFMAFDSAFVHAELPPCPPAPELATIVDTPEKCACFYALVGSGLDKDDPLSFASVLNDDTVQTFAQSGKYYGIEGILDYRSYVGLGLTEGVFVTDYKLVGQEMLLDMTGSTMEQCVATSIERRQLTYNPKYTKDNVESCADTMVGTTLFYTMTGNPDAPILVQKINSWLPDELMSAANEVFAETAATAEFVCDVIVNKCGEGEGTSRQLKSKRSKKAKLSKSSKSSKGSKSSKATTAPVEETEMEKCLSEYNKLPLVETSNGYSYIDGNSKGCRILHSALAASNSFHCPHVSFEADADAKGYVKCIESDGRVPTDLFAPQMIGTFQAIGTNMGLPANGIQFYVGSGCPDIMAIP